MIKKKPYSAFGISSHQEGNIWGVQLNFQSPRLNYFIDFGMLEFCIFKIRLSTAELTAGEIPSIYLFLQLPIFSLFISLSHLVLYYLLHFIFPFASSLFLVVFILLCPCLLSLLILSLFLILFLLFINSPL